MLMFKPNDALLPSAFKSLPMMAMMPNPGQVQEAMDAMMKAVPTVPGMPGMTNLAAHPMAAAAAGAAVSMGVASHMMGLAIGTMTGAMQSAATPWKMDWTFKLPAPVSGTKSTVAAPVGAITAMDNAVDAVTSAMLAATENMTSVATEALTDAVEASSKLISVALHETETATVAPIPAAKPKKVAKPAAAAVAPAAKAKPAKAKPAPAAPAAVPAKTAAADVAVSDAPAVATPAKPVELMPEDFVQPVKMEKPASPDDLKLISGIGPKLEQVLNNLGIWTFGQIAGWTPNEVAWMDDYLQFKGRIVRDNWMAKAKDLEGGADAK